MPAYRDTFYSVTCSDHVVGHRLKKRYPVQLVRFIHFKTSETSTILCSLYKIKKTFYKIKVIWTYNRQSHQHGVSNVLLNINEFLNFFYNLYIPKILFSRAPLSTITSQNSNRPITKLVVFGEMNLGFNAWIFEWLVTS